MEIDLPTPAGALREAYALINTPGGSMDRAERAKALIMMARELREGSRVPRVIITDDVELAQAAFGAQEQPSGWNATTYGDQADGQERWITPDAANDQTAVLTVEQPMPTPNDLPSIQAMVRLDLEERERVGIKRYGTPLQPHNGRDALRDAYEEALDLSCYLRQALFERQWPA